MCKLHNSFFCANCLLTNETKSAIISGARAIGAARFPLYHSPQVLSIGKLHKLSTLADPGIVQIYQRTCVKWQNVQKSTRIFVYFVYCNSSGICYNNKCQEERSSLRVRNSQRVGLIQVDSILSSFGGLKQFGLKTKK